MHARSAGMWPRLPAVRRTWRISIARRRARCWPSHGDAASVMPPPVPSNRRSRAEGAVMDAKRIRVTDFATKKRQGDKIVMLTAYDATMARLFDRAGIDALLVGDSLGTEIGRASCRESGEW